MELESQQYLEGDALSIVLSNPVRLAIGDIISVHDLKTNDFKEQIIAIDNQCPIEDETVDLQRLAVIIRAADILHTDASRIPKIGVNIAKLPEEEKSKYLARGCICGWRVEGAKIVLLARPGTDEEEAAVRAAYQFMCDQEWPAVEERLDHIHFPHLLDLHIPRRGTPDVHLRYSEVRFELARSAKTRLKFVSLPPKEIANYLCRNGRLSVISNAFVHPGETNEGGTNGAPNRFYVGAANCGKTRAALEWASHLWDHDENAWVVLLPENGKTLPMQAADIDFDLAEYKEQWERDLPPNALLMLDDLPQTLRPESGGYAAADAVCTVFEWFGNLAGFRDKRVVGTIRLDDVRDRPDWPKVTYQRNSERLN